MESLGIDAFLNAARTAPIVDVRTSAEFAQGHIPGAINLPLFNERERAEIGTLYRRAGRTPAVVRGLEIAGAKLGELAGAALNLAKTGGHRELLVHCWRGGMRSRGFGWMLEQVGIGARLLEGGYRAWRRAGQQVFSRRFSLVVLGGLTGCGKTTLLGRLSDAGEQVIDLEQLASHRGSAFGGIGLAPQPTVEHFENRLHEQLRRVDPARRLWIEAESQLVGKVFIPRAFFQQAIRAPVVVMKVSQERRIELLTEAYSELPLADIRQAVERIRKRLGGLRVQQALAALDQRDFARCAEICLEYYDRAYRGSDGEAGRQSFIEMEIDDPRSADALEAVIQAADRITNDVPLASSTAVQGRLIEAT
jgi:tRNA 2-selenouridine synthase